MQISAENRLENRKTRRETGEARGTTWNFDVEMDVGAPAPQEPPRQEAIPTVPPHARPPRRKDSGSEHSCPKSAQLLHARHARLPVVGNVRTRERKYFQDAWEESRRTAPAEEVKLGVEVDPDT